MGVRFYLAMKFEDVRNRFQLMNQAKTRQNQRFMAIKTLYEIYEQHLDDGEVWNKPYRFGELFGSMQRKYSDIIANLPEVRLRATRTKNQDFVIALQATLDSTENLSNSKREKCRALWDSVMYGTGILFEGYTDLRRKLVPINEEMFLPEGKKLMKTLYNGLSSERVDPRDFYIDETCTVFYDEAGMGARDCARVRIYPFEGFKDKFKDIPGIKNLKDIPPASYGVNFFNLERPITTSESLEKTTGKYVMLVEYWNWEEDFMGLYANGVEIYTGAIPFKHKRLPFVLYYNYRRDDSIWGISEAEILAPFIYSKEEVRNLMILDEKLALQPALAISGDIQFNPEEAELQPGAILTLRGLQGGKVADAIAPLRFGGIDASAFELMKSIEDSQIIVTGDDVRALYENPNQLATQTLSKREVAQKRLRSNIYQNTIESERYRAQIRMSNILQFYALPYQNIDGKVVFRRIRVKGYTVIQPTDETMPQFVSAYGAQNYFTLSPKVTEGSSLDEIEIEIVDAKTDENIKREEVDDMLMYLKTTIELAQIQPDVLTKMDFMSNLKQLAQKLNLNIDELFPLPATDTLQDSIDIELELVRLGQVPAVNPDQDPFKSLERYIEFLKSEDYKKMSNAAKMAFRQLIILTNDYVPTYLQKKLEEKRAASRPTNRPGLAAPGQSVMGNPGQVSQSGGGPVIPEVPQGNVPSGGQASPQIVTPPIQSPQGVASRYGFREA